MKKKVAQYLGQFFPLNLWQELLSKVDTLFFFRTISLDPNQIWSTVWNN